MSAVPGFAPTSNAPRFHNGPWPAGFSIHVDIAGLPVADLNATQFGLCGGMSFLTRDIFESHTPQLRNLTSTAIPMGLATHILSRLVDSFSSVVPTWLHKTQELDHGTWLGGPGLFAETVDAAAAVMAQIDAGHLCPIGVVLTQSWAPWDVFNNHVELVYAYDLAGGNLTLHVYDCNRPNNDSITITMDISSKSPAKTISTNGTDNPSKPGTIRGFFVLPYTHADPRPAYIDDAVLTLVAPPGSPLAPGQASQATVALTNRGSTTWDPGAGFRIGTQAPQDNSEWGTNRFPLPGPLDPEQHTTAVAHLTAPSTPGSYTLQLRMVHEAVDWFGTPSRPVTIGVGVDNPACGPLRQQRDALVAQVNDLRAELAQIDWRDAFSARHEAAILSAHIHALTTQIRALESQLIANGCPPA